MEANFARAGLVAVATLVLASCTQLTEIRSFTTESESIFLQIYPLVHDFKASCVRRKVADEPVDDLEGSPEKADAACKDFAIAEQQLSAEAKFLEVYFKALARLTDSSLPNLDQEIDAAATSLQSEGMSAANAQAAQSLGKILADAVTSRYQHRQLAIALQKADQPVAQLLQELQKGIGHEYPQLLAKESNALSVRYSAAFKGEVPMAMKLLIQDRWADRKAKLQSNNAAAIAAAGALASIQKGHHLLAVNAAKLSAEEVTKNLPSITASLKNLSPSIKAAP